MNWKTWAPLAVAVGLGLVAAIAAKKWMTDQGSRKQTVKMQSVVVASRDVGPGTMLSKADLKLTSIPADAAAPGMFKQASELIGRVVTTRIADGQAIVSPLLAPAGNLGGLSSLIPEGMRAVTLEINEFSGVGGLLTPGCRVDVLATLRRDPDHAPVTRTIAQDLKVIAVGQSLKSHSSTDNKKDNGHSLPRSATLLATPKQAALIQMASQNAQPWLMLRGGHDDAAVKASVVTLAELRGNVPAAEKDAVHDKKTSVVRVEMPATRPVQAGAQPSDVVRQTVQLIRGANESKVIFEMPANSAGSLKPSGTLMSSVAE